MIGLLWILVGLYLKCLYCEGSCGERNPVVGAEGGEVMLRVDPVGIMGDIAWFISGNHFATTESGKNIKIRDNRYKGKAYSMEDGSLLMRNITKEDQGTYRGSTRKSTSGKHELCALIYDLRVYEASGGWKENKREKERLQSERTSPVSHGREQKAEDYTALNIIRLSLAGCILIIMGLIFGHHMKTEVVTSSADIG